MREFIRFGLTELLIAVVCCLTIVVCALLDDRKTIKAAVNVGAFAIVTLVVDFFAAVITAIVAIWR